jgi:hypothetical protein
MVIRKGNQMETKFALTGIVLGGLTMVSFKLFDIGPVQIQFNNGDTIKVQQSVPNYTPEKYNNPQRRVTGECRMACNGKYYVDFLKEDPSQFWPDAQPPYDSSSCQKLIDRVKSGIDNNNLPPALSAARRRACPPIPL